MRFNRPSFTSHAIPAFTKLSTIVFLSIILLQSCQKNYAPDLSTVEMQLIAEDFVSPIQVVSSHNSERRYVVDQIGKVWVIDRNGYKRPTPFLDISSKLVTLNPAFDERGLLGFVLHPEFKANGRFFVYYQLPPRAGGPIPGGTWNNLSRISEFKVLPEVLRADMSSEKVLLEWDDPQFNHNGGTLVFGHDHYLYISIGDGGGANDAGPGHVDDWYTVNTGGNAQNIEANFFGKILRIDVDAGNPYGIPASNPFVGKPGLDEIFAFGFRNPYRMSFDRAEEHQLIVADAGQVLWEEVNVVNKGGNYGWNVKEGFHCFSTTDSSKELASCPSVDNRGKQLLDPVIEINNWQNPLGGKATTIIGGHVYRGDKIKKWQGKYIFGTFSQTPTTADGELFIATPQFSTGNQWSYEEISLKGHPDNLGYYLRGFGEDDHGEIYLAVSSMPGPQGSTGKVYKLVTAPY
ncbi:PQQ-dependent sugar dehydrogenase [Niastella caeni]|nr:PQQ-dependent sugar dehydrogenase [Niastella caeni]